MDPKTNEEAYRPSGLTATAVRLRAPAAMAEGRGAPPSAMSEAQDRLGVGVERSGLIVAGGTSSTAGGKAGTREEGPLTTAIDANKAFPTFVPHTYVPVKIHCQAVTDSVTDRIPDSH
jgi:hypothetical protein